ncbi:DUF397 domain-containing protein [Streptomyces sp. G45]|uniref:DUF397 domain-containing protein n=1 Tax=Streptomyces sp. G45 TaxID=3406627 RepID=UPI003C1D55DC
MDRFPGRHARCVVTRVSRPDVWRRSSYSNQAGGECVEVADSVPGVLAVRDSKYREGPSVVFSAGAWAGFVDGMRGPWRRSSHSNTQGGDCVEVADRLPGVLSVRDSKRPEGAVAIVSARAWAAFVEGLRGAS